MLHFLVSILLLKDGGDHPHLFSTILFFLPTGHMKTTDKQPKQPLKMVQRLFNFSNIVVMVLTSCHCHKDHFLDCEGELYIAKAEQML